MIHVFFIDALTKINVKKDSSLFLALTLKQEEDSIFILLEEDFYISNAKALSMECYDFSGEITEDFYVEKFKLKNKRYITLDESVIFHMRIDPPYDSRYQRYLWMQRFCESTGVIFLNNPLGIMKYNEKLCAYARPSSLESFVGESIKGAKDFCEDLKTKGHKEVILKPLDLFQGIGVEKCSIEKWETEFLRKCKDFNGPIIIQPFDKSVEKGEIRTTFFNAKEIGTMIKVPRKGDYLSNIAQGASFYNYLLEDDLRVECKKICDLLFKDGVYWIAFDILGKNISEVNITCPGLLLETSKAAGKNLAIPIIEELRKIVK